MTIDPPAVCEACGEPATRLDCEGVPLCEADYAHLLEHWRLEAQVRCPKCGRIMQARFLERHTCAA